MQQIFASPTRNFLQRNGFVMVSNLLLEFQQELEISDLEMAFIIKVMKNRPGYAITDAELDPTVSSKTLSRRRTGLKAKGLLNYSIIKKQDPYTGYFSTVGICYDLSKLEEKLQMISNEIDKENCKEIEKDIEKNNYVIDNDDTLNKFKSDWENYYGKKYNISAEETKWFNNLSEEDKKCISVIFSYFEENDLFDKLTPRLSLFMKVKFRFAELKKHYNGLKEAMVEDEKEEMRIRETEEIEEITDKEFSKYYSSKMDNFICYKAFERIVGRFYGKGEIPKRLLEQAYKDNKKYERK